MGINKPTYGRNASTISTRAGEYSNQPDLDFDGGLNLGGSCAPGIGVNTGNVDPKESDWTLNDQKDVARTPQKTQHIGGNGLGDGNNGTHDVKVVMAQLDETTPSIDDTAHFVEAAAPTVPGGDLGGGVINETGDNVDTGERVWGVVPAP